MSSNHCRKCGSLTLKETLTPKLKHYARIDCEDCGAFVKWKADPNTGGYKSEIASKLQRAKGKKPNDSFLESLESQFIAKSYLSNKQMECLDRILSE